MQVFTKIACLAVCLLATSIAVAQRPERGNNAPSDLVTRMMAFDKDDDGKLTRAEITDDRLLRLFDRADADKDGTVTKAELTALATKEAADDRQGPPRGGGGPGGFGGPGMGMGPPPPRPGEVLPPMLQQRLGLSSEQKTQIEALQKEVDAKLDKILTDEQKTELKQLRQRGPGGGPPGGFGRPPGGGPPPR